MVIACTRWKATRRLILTRSNPLALACELRMRHTTQNSRQAGRYKDEKKEGHKISMNAKQRRAKKGVGTEPTLAHAYD